MSAAVKTIRFSAFAYLKGLREAGAEPVEALAATGAFCRSMAARHREAAVEPDRTNESRTIRFDLSDAGYKVAELLEASHQRLLARRAVEAPAQRSEWFECDRPGCDAVIGIVGENGPDDEWDDYDPIAEHIAGHQRDDEMLRIATDAAGTMSPSRREEATRWFYGRGEPERDDERNTLPDVAGMRPGQMIDVDLSGQFVIVPATDARWMLPVLQQRSSSYSGLQSLPAGHVPFQHAKSSSGASASY